MIIFAAIFCSTMLHLEPDCQTTSPPMIFRTLQECRESNERYQRKPADKDGRVYTSDKTWWQCASKHVEQWEAR
jgi:hypothetical protein